MTRCRCASVIAGIAISSGARTMRLVRRPASGSTSSSRPAAMTTPFPIAIASTQAKPNSPASVAMRPLTIRSGGEERGCCPATRGRIARRTLLPPAQRCVPGPPVKLAYNSGDTVGSVIRRVRARRGGPGRGPIWGRPASPSGGVDTREKIAVGALASEAQRGDGGGAHRTLVARCGTRRGSPRARTRSAGIRRRAGPTGLCHDERRMGQLRAVGRGAVRQRPRRQARPDPCRCLSRHRDRHRGPQGPRDHRGQPVLRWHRRRRELGRRPRDRVPADRPRGPDSDDPQHQPDDQHDVRELLGAARLRRHARRGTRNRQVDGCPTSAASTRRSARRPSSTG